jgi:hypothetical protein
MAVAVLIAGFRLLPAMDVFKSSRPLAAAFVGHTADDMAFAVYPRLDNTVLFYTGRHAVPIGTLEALREYLAEPGQAWVFIERDELAGLPARELPLALVAREPPVEHHGYLLLAETGAGAGGSATP